MTDAAGEAVKLPDRYHVEAATVSVGHESVQFWPSLLRAGHLAYSGDLPASALAVFAKLAQVHFRGLPLVVES